MAKKKDVIALKLYAEIMRQAENPPLHPGEIETAVFDAFDEWQRHLSDEIKKLVSSWETEVPDDGSLYTLGLRRAQDVVNGEDPVVPPPNEAV
ncbi:MAG: hypothetical protein EBY03_04870 [Actinobacteria bacterium]|nr:hypothetical protein [Actinomycetota bacterium]